MTEWNIKRVTMSDGSFVWQGKCDCGADHVSTCGPQVHQVGKAHLSVRHGGGLIIGPNYRMEVKP